jgi:hypothetical protein
MISWFYLSLNKLVRVKLKLSDAKGNLFQQFHMNLVLHAFKLSKNPSYSSLSSIPKDNFSTFLQDSF